MDWRQKVRVLLNSTGGSQAGLARNIKTSPSTLAKWMMGRQAGRQEPKVSEGLKIARALGVTMDQLFDPRMPLPARAEYAVVSGPRPRRRRGRRGRRGRNRKQ